MFLRRARRRRGYGRYRRSRRTFYFKARTRSKPFRPLSNNNKKPREWFERKPTQKQRMIIRQWSQPHNSLRGSKRLDFNFEDVDNMASNMYRVFETHQPKAGNLRGSGNYGPLRFKLRAYTKAPKIVRKALVRNIPDILEAKDANIMHDEL